MGQHYIGKVATKAIIVLHGKALIVRDRRDDGIWELPGGRVNVGEDVASALRREVKEELGVDIVAGLMVHSEQFNESRDGSPRLMLTFVATLENESDQLGVPSEELAEAKWIDESTVSSVRLYDDGLRALRAYWAKR